MYLTAILLAAGKGRRLQSRIPKPLVKLETLPLIVHSLKALSLNRFVKDIIVVVNPRNSKSVKKSIISYRIKKVKRIVFGGKLRQDSVRKGLGAIGRETDFVLIHDAARPFIDSNMITKVVREARKSGAAVAGVPVKDTIKELRVSKCQSVKVSRTLERKNLWQIQTPQVFRKDLILEAYQRFGGAKVTDDASLVEKLGAGVTVAMGAYTNIKITTPEDLIIARAIVRNKK